MAVYSEATAAVHLAIGDPSVQSFLDRFARDDWRTFWCIVILVIVAAIVWRTISPGTGVMAGLGCWWFTWQVYNSLTGTATPLFVGARSPSNLPEFFGDHLFPWLALVIGLILGWCTLRSGLTRTRHRDFLDTLSNPLAALGTVTFVLMLYGLIFIELDVLGGVHWNHGGWV